MSDVPDIIHVDGMFLLFTEEHVLKLRSQRIYGQLIGCTPRNPHQAACSGLPCYLSHYATKVAYKYRLANFKKLVIRDIARKEDRRSSFAEKLTNLKDQANKEYLERRIDELRKRDLDVTDCRLGRFDEKKMKLSIGALPEVGFSNFNLVDMVESEVEESLMTQNDKMLVYQDLYDRGFYVSSGMKFGSDFLVYAGDPIRYHAQYTVKVVRGKDDGKVDLDSMNYCEINALQRLSHTANKIPLFAVPCLSPGFIRYWALRAKQYLLPESGPETFEPLNPTSRSF